MESNDARMETNKVTSHYQKRFLKQVIEEKITTMKRDGYTLELEDLALLDDLHIGGRDSTRQLAEKSVFNAGSLVLDVGSGIGGPVRIIANDFNCHVVGVDLSEDFSYIAQLLTQTVGIKNCMGFVNGDALKLPFGDNRFDAIWNQHCSMNIQAKKDLYIEFHRVLKKEGKLIIHDITKGQNQPIHFPVPWADSVEVSFLLSTDELKSQIQDAGFKPLLWNDISQQALSWYDNPRKQGRSVSSYPFNQKLVFGELFKDMAANMKKNLQENRIRVIEAIFQPG
ncbi:class I SAM-dependent methyltransferase [bacterium]|nr:class I SAM-dependent methyltransferase [bacterium]